MTDEQWYAIMDVHLTAPFRILRAASDFIRSAVKREIEAGQENYRKVVNISSSQGLSGNAVRPTTPPRKRGSSAHESDVEGVGPYRVTSTRWPFGLISTA